MFHDLKMNSLKKNLPLIILFFIVGLIFGGAAAPSVLLLFEKPLNLDTLSESEIHSDMLVEGTVYAIYGSYAHTTKTSGSKSEVVSQEYLIPVGEDSFIGLVAEGKDIDKCNTLENEFSMLLDGDVSELSTQFQVKGTILRMDSESLRYYHEALEYDDLSAADQARFLPYYLKIGKYGSEDLSSIIFLAAFAVFFLLLALILLIRVLIGRPQKELKKICEERGITERVEQFYQATAPKNGFRISRDYILANAGMGATVFLTANDFLWAYWHVTTTKLYGVIPAGKTHAVMLANRDGKRFTVGVKKEKHAKEVLDELNRMYPWAIIGYDEDINSLYNKNRPEFIRVVDERRSQDTMF